MKSSLLLASLLIACTAVNAQAPKPAAKKPAPASAKAKAPAVPATPVLADASEEQMVAIERAYLGTYDCEFKQSVSITRNTKQGYLDVMWKNSVITMKPVLSSTGALRLEDVTGRTLMIQIANKSMLLDTKIGQRLVDDCIHPEQRAAIEALKAAKAAALAAGIAPEAGLGIEPRATQTASTSITAAATAAAQAASAAAAAAQAAAQTASAAAASASAAAASAASAVKP